MLGSREVTLAVAMNTPERGDGTPPTPDAAEPDSLSLEAGMGAGLAEDVHRSGNHPSDDQE